MITKGPDSECQLLAKVRLKLAYRFRDHAPDPLTAGCGGGGGVDILSIAGKPPRCIGQFR